jgi:hypothetical protein
VWHQRDGKFVTKAGISKKILLANTSIESDGKLACIICQKMVSVMKVYSIKNHYDSKHEGKFVSLVNLQKGKLAILKPL